MNLIVELLSPGQIVYGQKKKRGKENQINKITQGRNYLI